MKVTHVKHAKKNIYTNGKVVEYVSKRGKRQGQVLTRVDRTQPENENDTVLVKMGEPYYFWKFRNRDKSISKTYPTSQQLKKYGPTEFETNMGEYNSQLEDDDSDLDELETQVSEYRDDLQSRLDNMPEQLQESSVLNEYIEQLDELISSISEKREERD